MGGHEKLLIVAILQAAFPRGATDLVEAPLLRVEFSDNADFQVLVRNNTWLQSGPLRFFSNGQWHQTLKSADSKAFLVHTGVEHSAGADVLGSFASINVSWSTSGESAVILHTTLKVYNDGVTVVFLQEIPGGARDTNASNPVLPGGFNLDDGAYPPILSFPSFSANVGKLPYLGYVTWQGVMVNVDSGVNVSAHLRGLASNGPVAIFDNDPDITTVVVSPLENFKNTVHSYNGETHAWETGVSSEVISLPKGFVHRTLLIAVSGITATMDA